MAGLITVRLHRNDAQPWGFRLQGGKDFGTPLLIQKVIFFYFSNILIINLFYKMCLLKLHVSR